jgi:hypothetical protein
MSLDLTMVIFLWSKFISLASDLEDQVILFMSASDRVAQLYPRQWVPFSSFSVTCGAIVEVF